MRISSTATLDPSSEGRQTFAKEGLRGLQARQAVGESKEWDNLKGPQAVNFMHYNFCRIRSKLRVTPAMEGGIADRVWEIEDPVYRYW
jgi:hypothetical protein